MPEQRIVLRNCGLVAPADVRSYLAGDGFQAIQKARQRMTPDEVIQEIKKSGLRGRGGAGFPTGVKWELAGKSPGKDRYVICNADEGEVGTFEDRYVLQNDPFSLFEGMDIACYAIGAVKAYLYVRGEYHYLLGQLNRALEQAKATGLPGCGTKIRE